MKVAHLFKTYFPDTQGGLQEVIRQIASYTTRYGIENIIYTVSPDPKPQVIERSEGKVVRYPLSIDVASTPFSFQFARNAAHIFNSADILHFHFPWPFSEILYLMTGWIHKPSLVTYHSDIIKQKNLKKFYDPFMNAFLRKVNVIVPTSVNYLNSSVDLRPFRSKCQTISLFLGEHRFKVSDPKYEENIRARFGDDFFLFVGVLRYYKGLQYLIPAMKDVPKNLIVVGIGPEREKLEKLTKQYSLKNVFFVGFIPDEEVVSFYRLARAIVFPSSERSEAFGMTILEALMMGKPIISTELGTGTSYANKHHVTGLVVPPKDVIALKEALMTFAQNDDLILEYGKNASKRFEENFTSEINGKMYVDLYEQLLTNFRKSS